MKGIPDVETAIARRRYWLRRHPAELAWEAELTARLDGTAKEPDRAPPDHERTPSDDGLEAALRPIDLRTIDLSPRRPRTGIERRLRETLGIGQPGDNRYPAPPSGRTRHRGPRSGPLTLKRAETTLPAVTARL